jgi:hypothetical protein
LKNQFEPVQAKLKRQILKVKLLMAEIELLLQEL